MDELQRQRVIDDEQLRLLRIGYFISGSFSALLIPFGLFYAGFALMMTRMAQRFGAAGAHPPPFDVSWLFGIIGAGMAAVGLLLTLLKFQAGRALGRRDSRMLILCAAAVSCLEIPYGTALGVLTFVVLNRASVEHIFDDPAGPPRAGY